MNIGIIGLGTVGGSVAVLLSKRSSALKGSAGQSLTLVRASSRKPKPKLKLKPGVFTKDPYVVVNDPKVDIVIELIGGNKPAKALVLQALKNGKHVVTANKALMADHGFELLKAAGKAKRCLLFEAAVGGGIPIIEGIRTGLVANKLEVLYAIINGTCNYVLTLMEDQGYTMKDAICVAQKKGFAESDPSVDVDGFDSAHKLALLSLVGFGKRAKTQDIFVEGIRDITPTDLDLAAQMGYCIKLLAIAKRVGSELELRVHPTLLPLEHPLASVHGVYNAVFVRGDLVGNQIFYGKGAGGNPTASSVLSDVIQVARADNSLGPNLADREDPTIKRLRRMGDVKTRYYMRFPVINQPGILAQIAKLLGQHKISIASVIQPEQKASQIVPVVITTHDALEKNVQAALVKIKNLEGVKKGIAVLRIEES